MKSLVISYSFTGNNEALAASVAGRLAAEHISVSEPKQRTNGTIISDLIFHRTPEVSPVPDIGKYDMVLIFGPVWIGQVATPLRAYLKQLKLCPRKFAFISISGGADGPNPKLASELKKRAGMEPSTVIDLHIADLLVKEPKPTREETSAYKLAGADLETLTARVVSALKEAK